MYLKAIKIKLRVPCEITVVLTFLFAFHFESTFNTVKYRQLNTTGYN